ncbi:hypothetical protein [Pistricoccus aurantiacus]|uniref:hypothetical protein n=1 Tax=Pistricoccus aurantiacus TaxID=1883414 RepID=UPI0036429A76
MQPVQYIAAIRRGEPINYDAFLRRLPTAWRNRHRELFATQKIAAHRWRVRCLDPLRLAELEADVRPPLDRVAAAWQGDSHRHETDTAYVLVHHARLIDARPEVVMLTDKGVSPVLEPKATALIVENEQNFSRPEFMRELASRWRGLPMTPASTDVVLGGGKRINRPLVMDWLKRYEHILCAFDYDLAGLEMYASLHRALGVKVSLLQPPQWCDWYAGFRLAPPDTRRYLKAISQAKRLGFANLARAFRDTGHFMEQEVLLEPLDE